MTDYALGFCSGFEVSLPFFSSVINAVHRDRCGVVSVLGGPVMHRNRNELCRMFLADMGGHVDRMVMVDTDIEFDFTQLDALLAHPEPIVTGVYAAQDGRTITDGCGFLKIDRDVIEKLMPYPFNPAKLPDGRVTGEDVGFRIHAKEAGYEVVVDHSIAVGHLKPQILRVQAKERELVGAA